MSVLSPQQALAARLLRKAGCPERAIGRILGVPISRVQAWRKTNRVRRSKAVAVSTLGWEKAYPQTVAKILQKAGL